MKLPFTISRAGKNLTFGQRLGKVAIWWGIPMLLLELVGVPWRLWIFILLIALPVAVVSVLCSAALQHIIFSPRKSSQPSTGDPRESKQST
jgi:cell division protein FtsW (lipid II flippase)